MKTICNYNVILIGWIIIKLIKLIHEYSFLDIRYENDWNEMF